MTLVESFVGFLFHGSRAGAKTETGAEKRMEAGAILRREIDALLSASKAARAEGDLWRCAESLAAASQKLDGAGAIRRAIEVRREAALAFTTFAETAARYEDVVAGYNQAARAFLVAGDIDSAKANSDRAHSPETGWQEL
jgi:hypothetical protein